MMMGCNTGTAMLPLAILLLFVVVAIASAEGNAHLRGIDQATKEWVENILEEDRQQEEEHRKLNDEEDGEIANGSAASSGEYPYFVSLEYSSGSFGCGGTLLSATRVLTAAHCFFDSSGTFQPSQFPTVRVNHITTSDGEQVSVDCVSIHPSYVDGISQNRASLFNDVAVIKLAASVTTTTSYVSLSSSTPSSGASLVSIGFGRTSDGGSTSTTLQKITESFVSEADCQCSLPCISSSYHVCALVDPGGVCQGDSGGPTLDSSGNQVGITSYGGTCGGSLPDVFANVAQFSSWINGELTSTTCTTSFDELGTVPCNDCNQATRIFRTAMKSIRGYFWN